MAEVGGRKAEILEVIAAEASIDPSIIAADTSVSDLGISSLDLIELIFKIEERFGVEIPAEGGPLENTDVKVFELLDAIEKIIDAGKGTVAPNAPAS
ncbi:acyl carrier protein [Xanthobacter sp. V3C-3]|uniref:acyl carrier protein n=1 Tax=Xanthobacter lutulentifluminis TaxID=3119935 RepID=UPI00372979B3